jgi:hypothetical protein
MKKQMQTAAACFLAVSILLTGGCIDAVRTGFAGGVDSAVSAIVETIIADAFAPVMGGE